MKLLDILAQELKVWPEDAFCIAQDSDGEAWPASDDKIEFTGSVWTSDGSFLIGHNLLVEKELADDHPTAIVTRAEWQDAVDVLKVAK